MILRKTQLLAEHSMRSTRRLGPSLLDFMRARAQWPTGTFIPGRNWAPRNTIERGASRPTSTRQKSEPVGVGCPYDIDDSATTTPAEKSRCDGRVDRFEVEPAMVSTRASFPSRYFRVDEGAQQLFLGMFT